MVSTNTPSDSNRASRRSFLGALGLAAGGGICGMAGLTGAESPGDRGRGGGRGRGHSNYDDPVLDGVAEYAVPVASEGEVHVRDLVPQANRVAPPGTVGEAASADEHAAATVVAGRLAEFPLVGLGESTHGTHEFHVLRRRIVQRLVAEHGLRVVAFEDQFSELVDVNDYVVHGEGSVEEALAAIPFWVWSTEEVRKLFEWLREFNEDRPRDDRVEVHGIDCQTSAAPASKLLAYFDAVDAEPFDGVADDADSGTDAGGESVQSVLETLADSPVREYFYGEEGSIQQDAIDTARSVVDPVRERLQDRRDTYVEVAGEYEWTIATRHLRALEQCLDRLAAQLEGYWVGWEARDRAMAENATWLLETLHSEQVAFWAHNGHAASMRYRDFADPLGVHLREAHGDDYYALGFDFGRGSFNAYLLDEQGMQQPTIDEPIASTPATLDELRPAELFLDFEAADANDAVADWLASDLEIHTSGSVFLPDQPTEPIELEVAYDGFVFVEESTPTSIVPPPSEAAQASGAGVKEPRPGASAGPALRR